MADPTVSPISACIVTPSTPTTPHHMFLAAVDIMWRAFQYYRYVLFFKLPADCDFGTCSHHLQRSLALALVEFFPLAGRLFEQPDGRLALNCNDAGVPFVEACIDTPFSSLESHGFQHRPFFEQLAPHRDLAEWPPDLPLFSVQVTRFAGDEGLAIGISRSHVVADGRSFWHFMKSWGECGRGVPISLHPLHIREALHPEKLILPAVWDPDSAAKSLTQGGSCRAGACNFELVQRDFHFSVGMMRKLKHMAAMSAAEEEEAPPGAEAAAAVSSLEALNAHIWKHVTAARCVGRSEKTAFFVVMDTRARCVPPLPEGYFGNAVYGARPAIATAQELEEESLGRTAMRIMEVVRSVGDTDVKAFYGKLEVMEQHRISEYSNWSMPKMHAGSSPRFPAYEVDFGWGSPVCVRCPHLHCDGEVALLPGPGGGGSVAACLALSRAAMEALEQDESFMSF